MAFDGWWCLVSGSVDAGVCLMVLGGCWYSLGDV